MQSIYPLPQIPGVMLLVESGGLAEWLLQHWKLSCSIISSGSEFISSGLIKTVLMVLTNLFPS